MKLKKKKNVDVIDFQSIKERLILENKYIMNISKNMPGQKPSDSKGLRSIITGKSNQSATATARAFKTQRAATLEELYRKLEETKGKSMQYQGKLIKKRLKNKVEKKKRRDQRRLKKTLFKGHNPTPNLKLDIKSQPSKPAKPVFNSEGKMVFSKFDFAESPRDEISSKKVITDPHKLLKKFDKRQEKFRDLEEKGEIEKVNEIQRKEIWKNALLKASGVKVRDDPQLLKKSLKRKEQQKKRTRKKWKARENQVQKEMEEKQQRRKANIDEHNKKKKSKKLKKMLKKGRMIPGYT